MSVDRERAVIDAFVSLSSSMARNYDVVDLLTELTEDCARLLDIASAGLLLADGRGVLHVLAASSGQLRQLEVFQLQRSQGPCLDCYRTERPVTGTDLADDDGRWPVFAPEARRAGYASVHALPMRLENTVIGALGLFGAHVGALNDADLHLGQALADVATVALIQDQHAADTAAVNDQLQKALSSRVVLEQAKGVIAQVGGLDMPEAFMALRSYARGRGEKLTDIAHAVVARRLRAVDVLAQARTRSTGQR